MRSARKRWARKIFKSNYNISRQISWFTDTFFWALIFSRRLFWIELELEYNRSTASHDVCHHYTENCDDTSAEVTSSIYFHFPHTKSSRLVGRRVSPNLDRHIPDDTAVNFTSTQLCVFLYFYFQFLQAFIVMWYHSESSQLLQYFMPGAKNNSNDVNFNFLSTSTHISTGAIKCELSNAPQLRNLIEHKHVKFLWR